MYRRTFLRQLAAATGYAVVLPRVLCASAAASSGSHSIMTVAGPIPPEQFGIALAHEHVLVDFVGADKIKPGRYSPAEAFETILPHLKQVRELGCRSLVECTPAYLGRDPRLLQRLAGASGLNLLTNTGYYGAAENKFLPAHAHSETADQLARRWTREWADGIEGTDVRPGFIKIGVGGASLSPLHRKLVQAAARAHRATGLTIASHTGPAELALEQLETLQTEGVAPSAFIWVHAQAEPSLARCVEVAERGCWVSYDGFSPTETERYLELIRRLEKIGRLNQLLLSHDAGWFKPGEPGGGGFRPFVDLFQVLFPKLREMASDATVPVPESLINRIMVENPARAFVQEVRLV